MAPFPDRRSPLLRASGRPAARGRPRRASRPEGHSHETVTVPGALEIPAAIALAAETGRYDGFVALGTVIRGETYHFEIVASESARGLMALTLDGLAIGNGILDRRE